MRHSGRSPRSAVQRCHRLVIQVQRVGWPRLTLTESPEVKGGEPVELRVPRCPRDPERPLIEWPRPRVIARGLPQDGEVVEAGRHVRMGPAQRLLPDRERPFVERPGAGMIARDPAQLAEVVEARGHLRMRWPQRLLLRDAFTGHAFMLDLAARLANRVQLTTDGHKVYLEAVEGAFGNDIDYAMLIKMYEGDSGKSAPAERRYSPAICIGEQTQKITGDPDEHYISTSHAER